MKQFLINVMIAFGAIFGSGLYLGALTIVATDRFLASDVLEAVGAFPVIVLLGAVVTVVPTAFHALFLTLSFTVIPILRRTRTVAFLFSGAMTMATFWLTSSVYDSWGEYHWQTTCSAVTAGLIGTEMLIRRMRRPTTGGTVRR